MLSQVGERLYDGGAYTRQQRDRDRDRGRGRDSTKGEKRLYLKLLEAGGWSIFVIFQSDAHIATRGDPGRARVSRAVAREPYMVLLGRPVSIQVKRRAWLFFLSVENFWALRSTLYGTLV